MADAKAPQQRDLHRSVVSRADSRAKYEFLPAALEVQQTPPPVLGRAILWGIVAFFVAVVAWLCLGSVDTVTVARGKIVPSGQVKLVQPLEAGIVAAIHVKEGQVVEQGEPLITLDSTTTQADVDRLEHELAMARQRLARHRAFLDRLESAAEDEAPLPMGADSSDAEAAVQRALLEQQLLEYRSRMRSLQQEAAQRRAELAVTRETITKLELTLPMVVERAQTLKGLVERDAGSRMEYLLHEQKRIEHEQDLAAQRARVPQLTAAIAVAESNLQALAAEYRRNSLAEIERAQAQVVALESELTKARQRNRRQVLTAPIAGVVESLAVHTVGGVVTPAEELMRVVPIEDALIVEALVENRDVGYLHENQPAVVKVDTFPYTRYGMIDGEVVHVSSDAVTNEHLGLVFPVRVRLAQSHVLVHRKPVNLVPGMTVTTEIKTGSKRLIEYFFDVFLRYKSESLRER